MSNKWKTVESDGYPESETGTKFEVKTPSGKIYEGHFMDWGFEIEDGVVLDFEIRQVKYREIPRPIIMQMLEDPELGRLKGCVEDYIMFVKSDKYHEDSDYKHYIFEEAVKAFYGEDIFTKINELTK